MKRQSLAMLSVAAICATSITFGLTSTTAAHPRPHRAFDAGKRLATALQNAGVDSVRIAAILEEANSLRPAWKAAQEARKEALRHLAKAPMDDPVAVRVAVEDLIAATGASRDELTQIVEQLGTSLTASEKSRLIVHIADRLTPFMGKCEERMAKISQKLDHFEAITAEDAETLRYGLETTGPTLCQGRDEIVDEIGRLSQLLQAGNSSEAEFETALDDLRSVVQSTAQQRRSALLAALRQLSPQSQVKLARRVVRVERAAAVFLGVE